MKFRLLFMLFVGCLFLGFDNESATYGQLPRDVRDVFEVMLDDLDDALRSKFEKAIENDTATVEFTPEEFKRFRDNPANPFEGLDQIDADQAEGNIALKFELPSIRNRPVQALERQSSRVRNAISDHLNSVTASMVRVFHEDRHVAMGTIVSSDGKIVTKASEVAKRTPLAIVLPDGTRVDARILRQDEPNDIALLKIEKTGLSVVNWSDRQPLPGSFLLVPTFDGRVKKIGTYSAVPRSTKSGEQAFLGVQPETTTLGVRISDIQPGNASYEAGLKDDDVITKLAGRRIADVTSLVKAIRDHRRGDQVEIEYLRNGIPKKTKATLSGRNVSGEQAARFKMMNRLGAIPSRRADNFPSVFQHDTPLFPEDCGGPITDLDGNVVGINIARQGRAASYAIPANHMQVILKDLVRETIAQR